MATNSTFSFFFRHYRTKAFYKGKRHSGINTIINNTTCAIDLLSFYHLRCHRFNPVNIITTLYKFSKFKDAYFIMKKKQKIFSSLLSRVREVMPSLNAQGLSNTAFALAKLKYSDKILLKLILETSFLKRKNFNAQEISNLFWAFSMLNFNSYDLISKFSEEIESKIQNFSSKNIVAFLWAINKMKIPLSFDLLQIIIQHALSLLKTFNSFELCSFLKQTIQLKLFSSYPEVLSQIFYESQRKIHQFSVKDMFDLIESLQFVQYQYDEISFFQKCMQWYISNNNQMNNNEKKHFHLLLLKTKPHLQQIL